METLVGYKETVVAPRQGLDSVNHHQQADRIPLSSSSTIMQFPQLALLGLGTFAFAAPAAEPEALAVPEARYGGGSHHGSSGGGSSKGGYSSACCPEGERSGCSYNSEDIFVVCTAV